MKRTLLIAALIFTAFLSKKAFAGGPQYEQAMKSSVSQLDSAIAPEQFIQLANTFERIAGAESKEWLPDYYAAYCYVLAGFTQHKDKKSIDDYLDKAESLINKADALAPNNAEIYAVKGFIDQGRIMVDPATRGKKYGTLASQQFKTAEKIDSLNPRPYFLEGQGLFHTPKMFGGGKEKAKPVLEKAVVEYHVFKPASDFAPHWGKKMADDLLKQCE